MPRPSCPPRSLRSIRPSPRARFRPPFSPPDRPAPPSPPPVTTRAQSQSPRRRVDPWQQSQVRTPFLFLFSCFSRAETPSAASKLSASADSAISAYATQAARSAGAIASSISSAYIVASKSAASGGASFRLTIGFSFFKREIPPHSVGSLPRCVCQCDVGRV